MILADQVDLVELNPNKNGVKTELEPCEDCISREEALNVVHKYFEHYLQLNDDICLDGLRSLPPVTPKEKTGKWINDWEMGMSECSCCGETYLWEDYKGTANFYFCPNCGCHMVEPQESEVDK